LTVTAAWVAFLRVGDERAARKLILRLQETLAVPLELGAVEKYWKDTSLYRCTFTTEVEAEDRATAIYAVLRTARRLAPGWFVNNLPPSDGLDGWASEMIAVAGVTEIGFSLSD
jgi:hypothetical protein